MKNFLFLILLLAGCDKEFVEPPMTANERFYCEIDGKIFSPRNNGDLFDSILYTEYFPEPKAISIHAINKISGSSEKSIVIWNRFSKNNMSTQKVIIDNINSNASFNNGLSGTPKKRDYYRAINGNINYTLVDTVNRKVSGTFEFDAKSDLDSTKLIKIRNNPATNHRP